MIFLARRFLAFNKPEPVFQVKCEVHPWTSAYVAVMTHPYFAVTGRNGSFKIDNAGVGSSSRFKGKLVRGFQITDQEKSRVLILSDKLAPLYRGKVIDAH